MAEINDWQDEPQINDWQDEGNGGNPTALGSAYRGLEQGTTFGFGDEAKASLGALYAKAFGGDATKDMSVGELTNLANASQQAQLAKDIEINPASTIVGNIGGALLTGVVGAGTKTGSAIANSLRSGSTGARIGKNALAGAASGSLYGAGQGNNGERLESAAENALLGGVVGGAIPAAVSTAKGIKNTIIPQVDESIKGLALRAKEFGIPLRLDQVAPTKARNTLQKVSQELPFSGSTAFEDQQRKAFTKAVAKTIGQDADNLDAEVVNRYLSEANKKFAGAIGNEPVVFDDVALSRFDDIANNASDNVTSDVADIVKRNIERFKTDIGQNVIDPKKLSSFRSDLIKRIPKADSQARTYLNDVVDVIDDVVEKQLPPEAAQTLSQARREYRNFKTIEPLLEKSPDGSINPTELLNRVKSSPYIKASRNAVGEDDLVDLARIGKQFLPVKGGSDTFQKGTFFAGGYGAATNPILGGTLFAGNRAFQKGYNQSQTLLDKALKLTPREINSLPPREAMKLLDELKKASRLNIGGVTARPASPETKAYLESLPQQ